jgi:3-dehydroquinate synthetase
MKPQQLIEKMTNYKIPHGLAVAHGINISNYFSMKLNFHVEPMEY